MMTAVRAQEASSSTSRCSYDVFLSFRGDDTRKTFTSHLYTALLHAGFHTFRDDDGIERGENIKLELQKAIQESRISIVVFSKDYASSSWCLDELVMILERKRTSGSHEVLPIFYDVDPSQVRKQMGSFEEAFKRHDEERLEAETGEREGKLKDKVKGWRVALGEAAGLAGMNLQNQANGHESKFIEKIVKVVGNKLSRTILGMDHCLIGIHSRAKTINLWLQDESTDVGMVAICGLGGIGKTTIAKFLYNLNFARFEGSSFLANVRETSKQQDGLLRLQKQLLSDILKGRKEKIHNIDEGIIKIKNSICCKRVFVVLDDVDTMDQLEAVLGMRDWLFPGSKIIITTRCERLLRAHEDCKVHRVAKLDYDESLELFSWYAFGQSYPTNGYVEDSERVVHHCGGLPLAIKVLGSSLSGKCLNVWKSQFEKLKAIPNNEILEKLKISYDSLQDHHDKNLFLHIACFFVGEDKDEIVTILDGCDFYTMVGIQNLIERCMLSIEHNKLVMHKLLQDMGREIVHRESPTDPGERSRLWNHKDSFNILTKNTGTRKIEGLILNMHLLKDDKSTRTVLGVNRKRHFEELLDKSLLSNVGNLLKKNCFGIFTGHQVGSASGNSNQVVLEVDAFATMHNLKLLQLSYVQLSGSFEKFPKGLKWLSWQGFPFKSIPRDFSLESLVILEMRNSSLKKVWEKTKSLESLKILDISHSYNLVETSDFSMLPNLERLILENCERLIEVHESVGHLKRLVLLNVKDCKSLRKLPKSIFTLKFLEMLDISGCSNLENIPKEMGNMESLMVLHADGTAINRLFPSIEEVKAWHLSVWPGLTLKPRKSPEISWASLPRSLVSLSLQGCNLSDDAFPRDFGNLLSLQKLNLSNNPICTLPNCIRDLNGLQELYLNSCTRLQSLTVVQDLKFLAVGGSKLLEKIIFLSTLVIPTIQHGNCDSIVEITGKFTSEPLENVDAEIINNLGLSNFRSMGKPNVKQFSCLVSRKINKLPLQGYHERYIFYIYLLGSKVPACYNIKEIGSSISFTVPTDLNFGIRGLSVCSVYELSKTQDYKLASNLYTIISNVTKSLIWSFCPLVCGIPEAEEEDMIMLSYWKFENQLEGGDEVNISVVTTEDLKVKEVGVHFVYYTEEQQKEKCTQSSSEKVDRRIYHYGNVVPGCVSTHPTSTKFYRLGIHPDYPDNTLHEWKHFTLELLPRPLSSPAHNSNHCSKLSISEC